MLLSKNISGFDIWARVDMRNNDITNDDTECNIFISFDDFPEYISPNEIWQKM